jgi:branched-subunit amino acid transport protein
MSDGTIWLMMIGMGVITFLQRLSFIAALDRIAIPPIVRRGLRFVPVAVLPTLIFPELLVRDGVIDFSLGNERLLAGAVAALVAWRTRNVLATIVIGMGVLFVLLAVGA